MNLDLIYEIAINNSGQIETNTYTVRTIEYGKPPYENDIMYYVNEKEYKALNKHIVHIGDFYRIAYKWSGSIAPKEGYYAYFLSDKLVNEELINEMKTRSKEQIDKEYEYYGQLKAGLS